MSNFLLLVPSIILIVLVFLNICKKSFSVLEIIFGALSIYGIVITVIVISEYIPIPVLNADILGNIACTICLTLFAQRKTKNLLLSGYYATLVVVIGMIGSTIASIFMEHMFSATIEKIRNDFLLFFITAIPTFGISFFLSKYIGNRLHKKKETYSECWYCSYEK